MILSKEKSSNYEFSLFLVQITPPFGLKQYKMITFERMYSYIFVKKGGYVAKVLSSNAHTVTF